MEVLEVGVRGSQPQLKHLKTWNIPQIMLQKSTDFVLQVGRPPFDFYLFSFKRNERVMKDFKRSQNSEQEQRVSLRGPQHGCGLKMFCSCFL